MPAAVFEGLEKITLREALLPEIGAGDLLLRVKAATICGTDLKIFTGAKTRGVRVPSILGHEIAGEIAAVGAGISDWQEGTSCEAAALSEPLSCCINGQENMGGVQPGEFVREAIAMLGERG